MSIHEDRDELLGDERGAVLGDLRGHYTGAEHVPFIETKNPERAVAEMPGLRGNLERNSSPFLNEDGSVNDGPRVIQGFPGLREEDPAVPGSRAYIAKKQREHRQRDAEKIAHQDQEDVQ